MAAVRKQRGCGRPELNFFFFFMQYLSRTMSAGSVGDRDGRASAFQLVNLAIMQQDQTPFSPSPGPVSETQSFWVDPSSSRSPLPSSSLRRLLLGLGCCGVSLVGQQTQRRGPTLRGPSCSRWMPASWAAGARRWRQGMSFWWRWP